MKRLFTLLALVLLSCVAFAQAEKSIIIDASKFRPVQTDALTGVNIDPIGLDYSKRPCARLKIKINRMTVEEINGIEVKVATNNAVMKCQTAQYDTGLIVEMTAKPDTRFYFHHNEFGDSNEVCLNLEPNKEYYLEAYLNQQYPITVAANVAGADVYLDGVYKGQTDANYVLTVKDVIPGEHALRVELGGIKQEQKIVVSASSVFFRQTINTQATKPQFVVFSVEPQSAVVIIDNKHYSLQDGAMRVLLENGTYAYTVTAAGYHSQSGNFRVEGQKVVKSITLTADAATVTITAPDNAEIWVNEQKKGVGRWSGTLNSGTYIFEARKAGHKSGVLSTQITSAKPQQSFTLPAPTPLYGSLMIDGTPIMADVALNGKSVGQTPLSLNNVLVGEHSLTISKSGYVSKTQKVTLAEGTTEVVNIALVKQSATTTSTTTSTTSATTSTSGLYKVGDYYNDGKKEGVIFEVSADGRSGKIVSMKNPAQFHWTKNPGPDLSKSIGAYSDTDGSYNMSKVKEIQDWQSKYPVFKWCADLGAGWYLPATGELFNIYKNIDVINLKLTDKISGYYWSSTEGDYKSESGVFTAWFVDFNDGMPVPLQKGALCRARAVAKIGASTDYVTVPTIRPLNGVTPVTIDRSLSAKELFDKGQLYYSDKNKAIQYFYESHKKGFIRSANWVGLCLESNSKEQCEWYRIGAEQGDKIAQYNLGQQYYWGEGAIKEDRRLAYYWHYMSALKGNGIAQYYVAKMFETGYCFDTQKDRQRAIYWYQKSAAQGENWAAEKLKKLGAR